MGDLLSKLLPLSLGAAVSPTVLGVILVILGGRRAVARGAVYVLAVLLVLVGLTAIGLYGVRQTTPSAFTTDIEHVIDGVAGVLLLLLALGTVLRAALRDPATPPAEPDPTASEHRPGLWGAFVLGLAMMLSNFSTILLYLPAMHLVATAPVTDSDQAVAVVIAFVITSLPATLPLVFRILAPGPAVRMFGVLHTSIARHQRQIGVAIEVIFGVWLVVKSVG